jgi:hypothetical protein
LPKRVRYQLERSTHGSPLDAWLLADTVPLHRDGSVPVNFRFLAAADGRLIVGNGDIGCLRSFQLPGGRALSQKCLLGIKRMPVPASQRSGAPRRVSFGDSLPRIGGLALRAERLAVLAVHSMDSATWLEFAWTDSEQATGRPLGRSVAALSFLSRDAQLIFHEDAVGTRIEVIRVSR